jgi:muramoyltetrapeptide carboxypeptidase
VRNVRRPRPISSAATLGVAAPAFAVDGESLDAGIEWLKAQGFGVKLDPGIRERRGYLAGEDARRAAGLLALLENPDVDAVVCARGGYGCQRILPYLDASRVAAARKPLLGYSDVTVLHLWQLRNAGLTGFHGPMLEHGGWSAAETEAVRAALEGTAGELYFMGQSRGGGRAEGRLVGGSLKLVATSLATPFEIDTDGAILLLEDVAEKPYAIDRMLQQLLAAGKLERAVGVAIGQLVNCVDSKREKPTAEEVVEEVLAPLGLPLVVGLPFGHGRPNLPWPVGVRGAIDGDRGELVVLEPGVER